MTTSAPDNEHDDDDEKAARRQQLHAVTGDRDAEAEALSDRSGDRVDPEDAKVAVQRAHGDRPREGVEDPDSDTAVPADAERAAEERNPKQ